MLLTSYLPLLYIFQSQLIRLASIRSVSIVQLKASYEWNGRNRDAWELRQPVTRQSPYKRGLMLFVLVKLTICVNMYVEDEAKGVCKDRNCDVL